MADDAQQPSAGPDAQLRSDVSRGTAPVLEGPAPEDLDARAPHVSRGTAGAMRRPSARRSKRPEPADQGFRRTVQKDAAALCQRGPPQVGTLATHRGVSRGTAKHRIRGLGSASRLESPRMFHVKPWQCSTVGHRSGRLGLPDVPDVSRGTRSRCSVASPARRNPGLTRMSRLRSCSAADARRVGHANRPGRRRSSTRNAHSPSGFRWNCAGAPGLGAADSDARTGWMFHVEPEASVWSDDASRSGRQDRMTD